MYPGITVSKCVTILIIELNYLWLTFLFLTRVQPDSSISLVMQLQASGGYDIYGYKVTHLAPRGWMKLQLFDSHNRLISGRWKVPIRLLPAKPSVTTAEVNAVPQVYFPTNTLCYNY